MQNNQKAVFLHGMWRSSSTYIWSCFRREDSTYCFYEPLHQGLGKITKERIYRDTEESRESNRHSNLSNPYFFEFEPLIKNRGVPFYKKHFGFKNYILGSNDKAADLKVYISNLISYSYQKDKTPVLGFNRAGLRLDWLKKNFDCYQIHIDRDPRDIFHSYYRSTKDGNYIYFAGWLRVLDHNPQIAKFCPFIKTTPFLKRLTSKEKSRYRKQIQKDSLDNLYKMVFALWLLHIAEALKYADLIIDINLSNDESHIENIKTILEKETDICLKFDDIQSAGRDTSGLLDFDSCENQVIEQFQRMGFKIDSSSDALSSIHQRKAGLLKHLS